jgi:hypothetical protein
MRFSVMPAFARYIILYYSSAETSTSVFKGPRIYQFEGHAPPVEVQPQSR